MAPKKKAQKISLNEFLGDDTLGSWADEMDSLPSAPAMRTDDDQGGGNFGRRGDDFLSSRPDRGDRSGPPREDLPMPTAPPYTAFIGNLSFDLTEAELEDFFSTSQTKSIKIIKDRDDKPKGFGYVEFDTLEGLKDGLAKSGSSFAGRTIRVSVAEPPKERSGFGGAGGGFDDSKFDDPWRRSGPLPDLPGRENREGPRRGGGFENSQREDRPSGVADGPNDWRASQPARVARAEPPARRSGFPPSESTGAADREDKWSKGSRLPPPDAPGPERGSRFGAGRGDRGGDMGPPPPASAADEVDQWRSASRPARPTRQDSTGPSSPTGSTPSTPALARRKLELLPRSASQSSAPSPLGSPKATGATPTKETPRSNPFGAAKPVDVTSREREVAERVEKDREQLGKTTMSRTNSRTATERPAVTRQGSGNRSATPASASESATSPSSPTRVQPKTPLQSANVRPTFSFAKAAQGQAPSDPDVDQVTEKVAQTTV